MNLVLLISLALTSVSPLGHTSKLNSTSAINIRVNHEICHISPWMYGSCIEDVNHEIYGGLYDQRIFGESFEEPPGSPLTGWTAFGGNWTAIGHELTVAPAAGAKLVRNQPILTDGTVACDIRFPNANGDNAGLILRVNNPRDGADSWTGYEVSLSVKDQALILGSHRNNWKPLKSVPIHLRTNQWYRLKVELIGSKIKVTVGRSSAALLEYDDGANAIRAGEIGLRTWNSRADFKDLRIATQHRNIFDQLTGPSPSQRRIEVSGMWDPVVSRYAHGQLTWSSRNPYNSSHCQRIQFIGGTGTIGVSNRGLNHWGIAVSKGRTMIGHLYVRGSTGDTAVTVALQSADGQRTYAVEKLARAKAIWGRQDFQLTPDYTDAAARFAIWLSQPGTVDVDQVYLGDSGAGRFHGGPFRADIGNMLVQEGLTFLRYGGSMVNSPQYRWKNMIGPRDSRPQYDGTWYPYSTNGFAIPEFLQFCNAAHIKPAIAINIDETGHEAADMVQYLNGPVSSYWGAKRAADGHPRPYGVEYIEIGNEEAINGDTSWYKHYLDRFEHLYAAMYAEDPKLKFIVAAWWRPKEPWCEKIAKALNGKAALWDIHVDADSLADATRVDHTLTDMQAQFAKWIPGTSMRACILEENGNRHDLQRALAHARILNVAIRHGNFVRIDCPANCLQPFGENDNGWDQGQVFFTPSKVWGMPPYYAQQMAALNKEPVCVAATSSSPNSDLDTTVTRSKNGNTIVLSVVNIGAAAHLTRISLEGFIPSGDMKTWTLTGELNAVNTTQDPTKVTWHEARLRCDKALFNYTFLPHSFTILRLQRK